MNNCIYHNYDCDLVQHYFSKSTLVPLHFLPWQHRSLIANLIMLPAGQRQNQTLAFLCLLTGAMHAHDFSTKNVIKTRHPYRHKCTAKFLCWPIASEILLPTDFFENSLNPLLPEVKSYPQKLYSLTLAPPQPNEFSFSPWTGLEGKALISSWTNYLGWWNQCSCLQESKTPLYLKPWLQYAFWWMLSFIK